MRLSLVELSLNARAAALADAMAADAGALGLGVAQGPGGETLIDCGHHHPGSAEAGLLLARLCLADLAEVALAPGPPRHVAVRTAQPALACLGSQYAGWHLATAAGTPLMGSGPARALARREPLFDDLDHREHADRAILVLEGEEPPDDRVAAEVAEACGLPRAALTLLHAPTGSPAGTVQIAARVIECAVQKARHLGFPLADLREAMGTAPVADPQHDQRAAMGLSNDLIIYGGRVHLLVAGDPDDARDLCEALPPTSARDWGKPFAKALAQAGGDFAALDPGLFAPAAVAVTALRSGETFRAGEEWAPGSPRIAGAPTLGTERRAATRAVRPW